MWNDDVMMAIDVALAELDKYGGYGWLQSEQPMLTICAVDGHPAMLDATIEIVEVEL